LTAQPKDFTKRLKDLLYAEQSVKEELASLVQFDPDLNKVFTAIETDRCEAAFEKAEGFASEAPPDSAASLLLAYTRSECGDRAGAAEGLRGCLASVKNFSHPTLKTWCRLRQLGARVPPEVEREVPGLIVEIGLPNGVDTIAAYADGSSRFFSHAGGAVLGEERRTELHESARRVVSQAGAFLNSTKEEKGRGGSGLRNHSFHFFDSVGAANGEGNES